MLARTLSTLKTTLLALLPISIGAISLLWHGESSANTVLKKTQLPLPELQADKVTDYHSAPINQSRPEDAWTQHKVKIKPNGSLSIALDSLGIGKKTTYQIRKTPNSKFLTQLRAGDTLQIWLDKDNQLQKILYPKNKQNHYELMRSDEGFSIYKVEREIEIKIAMTSGRIKDSFYLSGKAAGLSAKTIMNLADIFTWEIDFIRQLRKDDPFKVIYEKKYINGQYIGDGDILAAEVVTAGNEKHTAFLLRDQKGKKVGYYDDKKKNLKKAFLRNPVDYVRITSRFKPKRYHPVLKKWRAHRGVDYAGPTGTPIHATGDGKIIKRTWSRSYGRVIYIQHANKYTTVYGHMSKFGKYKKGQWVKQGATIGYIGQTGLATGPHLHYEFRDRGKHVDPLKVKFPAAGPVPKKHRDSFVLTASIMSSQLDRLSPDTMMATNFE